MSITHKKIREMIDEAKHILLLTDERIDGDTIGSTLGMYHVLKEMGKHVEVYSPKPMDSTLAFLPGTEVIQRHDKVFEQESIDLMIIFDCSDGVYIQEKLKLMPRHAPLISIDHHATNPMYAQVNLVEPNASAAADVVWRLVKNTKMPINKDAAQCILAGITTDTSAFSTSNTTAESFEAAHELSRYGGNLQDIIRETMMNKSVSALKLWGLAFERLHFHPEFKAITTVIRQKDLKEIGATSEDLNSLSNFLNEMVEGYDMIMVLKETEDGSVKASMRSLSGKAADLAMTFGGGGHKKAAGFKIPHALLVENKAKKYWEIKKV